MISTLQPKSNPYPWCVVRHLPDLRWAIVARFQRRSDADGYVWVMRRLTPDLPLAVVFDAGAIERTPESAAGQTIC